MPVYEYMCPQGHVTTQYRRVENREHPLVCFCTYMAVKAIVTPPRVFSDYDGYVSPSSGQYVSGRRQRVEDLKRTGCRPYEAGEREAVERHRAREEQKLDREVDAIVDQSMELLTSHDEGSDARKQIMGG